MTEKGDLIQVRVSGRWHLATYRGRSDNGSYVVARRVKRTPAGVKPTSRYVDLVRDSDVRAER